MSILTLYCSEVLKNQCIFRTQKIFCHLLLLQPSLLSWPSYAILNKSLWSLLVLSDNRGCWLILTQSHTTLFYQVPSHQILFKIMKEGHFGRATAQSISDEAHLLIYVSNQDLVFITSMIWCAAATQQREIPKVVLPKMVPSVTQVCQHL